MHCTTIFQRPTRHQKGFPVTAVHTSSCRVDHYVYKCSYIACSVLGKANRIRTKLPKWSSPCCATIWRVHSSLWALLMAFSHWQSLRGARRGRRRNNVCPMAIARIAIHVAYFIAAVHRRAWCPSIPSPCLDVGVRSPPGAVSLLPTVCVRQGMEVLGGLSSLLRTYRSCTFSPAANISANSESA